MNNETLSIITNAIIWIVALTGLYKAGMYLLKYYLPLSKVKNAEKSEYTNAVAKALENMKE